MSKNCGASMVSSAYAPSREILRAIVAMVLTILTIRMVPFTLFSQVNRRPRASSATTRAAGKYESNPELSGVEGGRGTASEGAIERAERRRATGAEWSVALVERMGSEQRLATRSGADAGSEAGGEDAGAKDVVVAAEQMAG